MTSPLEQINQGLAILRGIRLGHHDESGVCAECGQTYPCVTIQSLDEGMDQVMAEDSKGAQQTASMKKKKKKA